MFAQSVVATSLDEVFHCVDAHPAGTVTLAVAFASVSVDMQALARGLAARGAAVFGCSSAGEFASDSVLNDSISVLLLGVPRDAFAIRLFDAGAAAGDVIGQWLHGTYANPAALIHVCGHHQDGEALVHGIQAAVGRDIPVYGGSAGTSNELMSATHVFDGEQVRDDAIVVLALDADRLMLTGFAVSGWASVGMAKTVTKAAGNVVYSFDGQPALDVYEKYLPFRELGAWVGVNYPLQVCRPDGSTVLRGAFLFREEDKSVTFFASVREGSSVKFSVPPGSDITDAAIAAAEELKPSFPTPEALVVYSCLGRRLALGPGAEDEIARLSEVWPKVPLAGGFTFGEIGNIPGSSCEFHNHTVVVVLIGERK